MPLRQVQFVANADVRRQCEPERLADLQLRDLLSTDVARSPDTRDVCRREYAQHRNDDGKMG